MCDNMLKSKVDQCHGTAVLDLAIDFVDSESGIIRKLSWQKQSTHLQAHQLIRTWISIYFHASMSFNPRFLCMRSSTLAWNAARSIWWDTAGDAIFILWLNLGCKLAFTLSIYALSFNHMKITVALDMCNQDKGAQNHEYQKSNPTKILSRRGATPLFFDFKQWELLVHFVPAGLWHPETCAV